MWSSKALQCHCGKRWQQGGLWVKATVHLKMNMFFQKPFDEIFLWNTKADVCFPYICQSLKTILSVCFSHKSICDNKIRGNCDLSHHSDLFFPQLWGYIDVERFSEYIRRKNWQNCTIWKIIILRIKSTFAKYTFSIREKYIRITRHELRILRGTTPLRDVNSQRCKCRILRKITESLHATKNEMETQNSQRCQTNEI